VRRKLLDGMSPAARQQASARLYSFCHREPPLPHETGGPAAMLRIDVMLTKPYADKLQLQDKGKDATNATK
jgi:hypothetical protein